MMRPDENSALDRGNRKMRAFDRRLGIPLVAAVSLLRRRRPRPENVRSIGFLLLGAIGDSLLASSVIAGLRKEFPQARFTCFVNASNRSFADFLTGVDEIRVLKLQAPHKALAEIRRQQFDVLIDFAQWARITALFAALARACFTIGFSAPGQARHFAFDAVVPHSNQVHEIDNFHALAAPLLGHPTTGWPRLEASGDATLLPAQKRWIVFHPWPAGYRCEWRAWPQDRWVALGKLVQDWGYGIAISGGPADRAAAETLAARIGEGVLSFAGKSSLRDTVDILAKAAGVVAVNTGIMHLAAALDRPLVGLHGPTNALRWGPLSDKAIALGAGPDQGCAYLDLGFEYPLQPPDCMGCIPVEEVAEALRSRLPHCV